MTAAAGIEDVGLSRAAQFADLDNDEDLDLILLNDDDGSGLYSPSQILRNEGNGTFSDVTAGSGFTPVGYFRMGMALADYDLDGRLDIYVTVWTRELGSSTFIPFAFENRLYRNLGGFQFADVTFAAGLGHQGRRGEQRGRL